MKTKKVKDVMVPLSEYATVPETATLLDAVNALKKAQAEFDQKRDRHRAILVIDSRNHFVGKLSQHDVIEALEPNYKEMRDSAEHGSIHRLGFTDAFFKRTLEQYHLWERALEVHHLEVSGEVGVPHDVGERLDDLLCQHVLSVWAQRNVEIHCGLADLPGRFAGSELHQLGGGVIPKQGRVVLIFQ